MFLFFFNDTATTEIYTLSLHDALPIFSRSARTNVRLAPIGRGTIAGGSACSANGTSRPECRDRKSTRLNSSHVKISYAVFCLKKKKMHDDNSTINNMQAYINMHKASDG